MHSRALSRIRTLLIAVVAFATWLPADALQSPAWPDTYVARLEALSLVQTLNGEILASRSATRTLEQWCRRHRLAADPIIVADVSRGTDTAPTVEQRQRLRVLDGDEVKYRRVHLRCGSRVLSHAHTWYVASHLTPEMNRLLETTATPFGRAVEPLMPYRSTFDVKMLWSPLPDDWPHASKRPPAEPGKTLAIPDALFEHRAMLYTGQHQPFAEVHEVYQREILAVPR